jgi:4-methylaminobutanoate oxidase (formaldehyde-forming)
MKSAAPFLGRAAIESEAGVPLKKRLVTFTVEDPSIMLFGRETIIRNSERVGYLTSGGWGYTVKSNIGMGYVRNGDGVSDDFLQSGLYHLEVATVRVPAKLHFEPPYDPDMIRVRA